MNLARLKLAIKFKQKKVRAAVVCLVWIGGLIVGVCGERRGGGTRQREGRGERGKVVENAERGGVVGRERERRERDI